MVLCIILLTLLATAKFKDWFGFWGWGPRYILPVIPLLMLPLGYWFTAWGLKNKIKKYSFIAVGFYSLIIQLAGTMVNWHARFGYLELKGRSAILYTVKYSQWWDSLKTLFINLWNLLFGGVFRLACPLYPGEISQESLYASKTIFTWWNRLMFMGVPIIWIILYLFVSFMIISYSLMYMYYIISRKKIRATSGL